jgi:hypothetical protein
MDLKALRRIAWSRWWLLALAMVLAFVIVNQLSEYRQDNLPAAEAYASVTFIEDPTALERDEFEALLETQFALAQTVNADIINETPGAFIPWKLAEIELEFDQNQIEFVGRGATQQEANEIVDTMRNRYLASSPIGAGRDLVSTELDELTEEIATLRGEVAAATQAIPLTEEEIATESRRQNLTAQVEALRGHYSALIIEQITPVLRTPAQIQADIDETLARVQGLEVELAAIPLPPTPEERQSRDLDLLLDQLRVDNLQQRWDALYQRGRELAALATESPTSERPVTVETPSGTSNMALAVFGALLIAIAVAVAYERARGIIWSPNDIEDQPAVFVEVAPRPRALFRRPSNLPWYLGAAKGPRKAAVQNLRGALEEYQDSVVAFQGAGARQVDVRELTADVAVAAAVSGRSVLLIDTAFNRPTSLVEYDSPSTLGDLLSGDIDDGNIVAILKDALSGQVELLSGLIVLPAGEIDADPADILSRARFAALLQVAKEMFDIVLISGVDVDDPASHVLANRANAVMMLGAVGHSEDETIETAERDLVARRASLAGVVLLRRRRSKIGRWSTYRFRRGLYNLVDRFQDWRRRRGEDD